jgi:hypothetical protein
MEGRLADHLADNPSLKAAAAEGARLGLARHVFRP